MQEHGMYFPTEGLKQVVVNCGGVWNDTKERPLVCLIKSTDNDNLYWAIPMGDMNHRSEEQRKRLDKYMSLPSRDIRSCYYHIGRTDKESLFFISDAIPITDEYIKTEYTVNGSPYVIKNKSLIAALQKKLFRILAEENRRPNLYRQHITSVKVAMLKTLNRNI